MRSMQPRWAGAWPIAAGGGSHWATLSWRPRGPAVRASERMRGTLWAGVAVQALGALATLCIGIVIAGWQGPAAQGQYGLVRSTADLVLALALFGLPQSLVHAINQQRAEPGRAAGLEPFDMRQLCWPWRCW